jgi:hypothetical protein
MACKALGEGSDLVEEWSEIALARGIDVERYLAGLADEGAPQVHAFGERSGRRRRRPSREPSFGRGRERPRRFSR